MFARLVGFAWLLALAAACTPSGGAIEITTLELPNAVRGQPYEATLSASGGIAPRSFALATGSQLPPGLRLNGGGQLMGVPQQTGRFTFGVDVSDRVGGRASVGYLLVVDEVSEASLSTCASPTPILLTGDAVTLEGSFATAGTPEAASCAASWSAEQVYVLDLAEPADLVVEDVPGDGITPTFRTMQRACGASEAFGCRRSSESLLVYRVSGRVFLVIENPLTNPMTKYAVAVRRLPPTPEPLNDRCENATPLSFSGQSAPLPGTLRGATTGGPESSCSSAPLEPDVWFTLPIEVPSRVRVSTGAVAEVLRPSCGAAGPGTCLDFSRRCVDLEPGQWLLRLSGDDQALGEVQRVPIPGPPPNDTCPGAAPIIFSAGEARLEGKLWGARNDLSLPCSSGVDVMYSLVVTERSDLSVNVSAPEGRITPVLMNDSCTVAEACPPGSGTTQLKSWGVPPGRYRVVLQGQTVLACSEGPYVANVRLTPSAPAPANDTCAGAPGVVFTNGLATLDGTTIGATDDVADGCNRTTSAPDVFYRVTLSSPTRLRVIPTVGFTGLSIRLMSAPCANGAAVACEQSSNRSLETSFLGAGDYFLVVDGTDGSGAFQLIVQQF
jgi:hypothetical protein